jgi:hypothetical protein
MRSIPKGSFPEDTEARPRSQSSFLEDKRLQRLTSNNQIMNETQGLSIPRPSPGYDKNQKLSVALTTAAPSLNTR